MYVSLMKVCGDIPPGDILRYYTLYNSDYGSIQPFSDLRPKLQDSLMSDTVNKAKNL